MTVEPRYFGFTLKRLSYARSIFPLKNWQRPSSIFSVIFIGAFLFFQAQFFTLRWSHMDYEETFDYILDSVHFNNPLPPNREQRFPSVEERVQVYMSNWYNLCKSTSSNVKTNLVLHNSSYFIMNVSSNSVDPFIMNSDPKFGKVFILDQSSLDRWIIEDGRAISYNYGNDGLDLLNISQDVVSFEKYTFDGTNVSRVVFLVQFGDQLAESRAVPIIAKFRTRAVNKKSLDLVIKTSCKYPYLHVADNNQGVKEALTYQPIVWNFNSNRHFGELDNLHFSDVPWEEKKFGAIFRGELTGDQNESSTSFMQLCESNERCRFVVRHRSSRLVNARLVTGRLHKNEYTNQVSRTVIKLKDSELEYFDKRMNLDELLQHKVLISLEGNDVSSGLKWMLLSQSVVMMPHPTRTSWLMEEILQPWIHYIPIDNDFSNVEKRMKWVEENDEKARRIAERGTLFMYDLLYHEDALNDDIAVKREILRRYARFWTQQ